MSISLRKRREETIAHGGLGLIDRRSSMVVPATAAAVAETVFLDSEMATATQASKAFIEPNILAIDEKSDSRRQLVVVLPMEREFPRGSPSK